MLQKCPISPWQNNNCFDRCGNKWNRMVHALAKNGNWRLRKLFTMILSHKTCNLSLIYIPVADKHVCYCLKDILLGRRVVFSTADVVR